MDIKLIDGALLLKMFRQGTFALNENKEKVDALNVFPVPDGDTGTNMSLTMNSALSEALKSPTATVENVSKAISKGSLMGARGNSGVILSQIFRGFAKACEGKTTLDAPALAYALKSASDTAYKAVMKPVEGTILTVIRKTAKKAVDAVQEDMAIHDLLEIVVNESQIVLDKTPAYLEVLKQAGVVDAGGKGLVCIFQGFWDAVLGKETQEEIPTSSPVTSKPPKAQSHFSTEEIHFGYCTEFIVKGDAKAGEDLREKIQELGDSMVFVQDDDLTKVHVHTNHPGKALEFALEVGELVNIKIENMKQQHSTLIDELEENMPSEIKRENEERPYGIISVSMGKGLSEIFKDLGVHNIIEGGQTMNPSTEDIVKAIENTSGDSIFILPNNGNIILAAEQASKIMDRPIYVVPSKSIPQGINALLAFETGNDWEMNKNAMSAALNEVKTVQVTYSVRDTVFNDMDIKKDDILGVAEGKICAVGQDIHDVTRTALSQVIDENAEVLSLYYGEDVNLEDAKALASELEKAYENMDVELYEGGQPLYYYICSIE